MIISRFFKNKTLILTALITILVIGSAYQISFSGSQHILLMKLSNWIQEHRILVLLSHIAVFWAIFSLLGQRIRLKGKAKNSEKKAIQTALNARWILIILIITLDALNMFRG